MSSLHIVLDGRSLLAESHEQQDNDFPESRSTIVDSDVLQRVANLSLSHLSTPASLDVDEQSTQAPTELISTFTSPPLSPISGSITSFDFERNSSNDELSSLSPQPSLYSLTESLKEQATRVEYGRAVNTHSEVYKLAGDEEEFARLDEMHYMFKKTFGDYPRGFREVLADNDDTLNPKSCLDIGCGSGAWILEVAANFPHVSCTAVDLIPLPALNAQIPSNLRFEIDDVSLGLEHFAGDFNVVHVRNLSAGVRDYYRLIDDVALALRPRGLADFTETDWRSYDIEKQISIPTTKEIWGAVEPPDGWTGTGMARSGNSPARRAKKTAVSRPSTYIARFSALARQAVTKRGGHIDTAALLNRWISEHHAYEDVEVRDLWFPCGEWMCNENIRKHPSLSAMTEEEIERLRDIGKVTGHAYLGFMGSARPLLLGTGVPEEVVNSLSEKAAQEIREGRTPIYFRAQNVHARKKERRPEPATLSTV